MSDIRIGISGWRYVPWRKDFYPEGLAQKDELSFASRAVNSIELNGSFYALQRPKSYTEWYAQTPDDFVFSIKGPRFITHVRRLKDIEKPLANFFASGLFCLREKLGPILWQFPPTFRFDAPRFEAFLALLPRDTQQALELAKGCEARMDGRSHLEIDRKRRLRHAVEIRHESFVDPAFISMLRKYKVALVVADTSGKWPYREDMTSDFMYLRLHGAEELYTSGYSEEALDRWALRIQRWTEGSQPDDAHLIAKTKAKPRKSRDLYCYFDNDVKVRAPYDARKLLERLGLDGSLETQPGQMPQGPDDTLKTSGPEKGSGQKEEQAA
jgi:uncharacterized protein YecE (DUF72 family)